MLRRGDTRKAAIEALAAYDEQRLLPLLAPYFEREAAPLHLPKVFERLATPAAYEMLLSVYPSSGHEMKNRVAEALSRIRRGIKVDGKQTAAVEALALQECELYWALNERLTGLDAVPSYGEVAVVGEQLRMATVWRLFQLLGLLYDAAAIRAVYANWTTGDARQQANAMEAVDQLTHGPVRIALAKLMNARKPAANVPVSPSGLAERLAWLNGLGDEWLRQTIRYAASPEAHGALKEHMERIRLLRSYSMFRELTSRELSDVAVKLKETAMSRGERIFEGSGSEHALYLIRSGTVGFYRDGVKVGERTNGESFGQAGLLTRRERTAEARAEGDGLLWKLDSDDFYEVMFDRTSIAIEMMKQLSRRLRSVLAQRQASGGRTNGAATPTVAPPATHDEVAAAASLFSIGRSDSLLRRVLILRKIDLFSHLAEADLLLLAQMVDETEYEAGEAICRVGEYGDALYGIIEGAVRVHRGGQTFATLGEGDSFGEMAIIDSGPRSADCTAEVPTVLLQLHRDRVFSLCFQNMDVLRNMMQVMGDRLQGMSE
jgi:CRP-like cAMP-binding protein